MPRPASTDPYWEAMITPASAAVKPETENSRMVVRPTGTPRLRAAWGF